MLRHVFDVVLVFNEGVSMDPALIGLFEPLGKVARVFIVEHDEDAVHTALFLRVLPVALVALGLGEELEQAELAPVAELVFVLPEALSSDSISWDGAISLKPGFGKLLVELAVIEILQRKPSTLDLLGVAELHALGEEKLFDVDVAGGNLLLLFLGVITKLLGFQLYQFELVNLSRKYKFKSSIWQTLIQT